MASDASARPIDPVPAAMAYRPEVDGLRALAVTSVVLSHAGVPGMAHGTLGVDVFFVISGYVISRLLLDANARQQFSFPDFLVRRIRRIVPPLLLVLFASVLMAWLWLMPDQLMAFARSLVAVIFLVPNIHFWRSGGYFDTAAQEKPLLHLWSLGVEEQFYLVFPIALAVLWRFGPRIRQHLLLVSALASFALAAWVADDHPIAAYFLAPTRAWQLMAGALLADAERRAVASGPVPLAVRNWLASGGILLILVPMLSIGAMDGDSWSTWRSLFCVLGTSLILAAGRADTFPGRVLASRLPVSLGLVSYGVYLWHQPLYAFARLASPTPPGWPVLLVLALVATALAALSWRYLEQPVRHSGKVSVRALLTASGVVAAGLLAFALFAESTAGFRTRLAPAELALLDSVKFSPKRATCHVGEDLDLDPAQACIYFGKDATWAALGDSHVVELAYALAERLRGHGSGVLHLSASHCPPLLTVSLADNTRCRDWLLRATRRISSSPSIRHVLVSFRMTGYSHGELAGQYPSVPAAALKLDGLGVRQSVDLLWLDFHRVVDILIRSGKQVYVVGPVPELPLHITRYAQQLHVIGGENATGTTRSFYVARNSVARAAILAPGAPWTPVDPAIALCDGDYCLAIRESEALYFDDNHLSLAGARRVVALLRVEDLD